MVLIIVDDASAVMMPGINPTWPQLFQVVVTLLKNLFFPFNGALAIH